MIEPDPLPANPVAPLGSLEDARRARLVMEEQEDLHVTARRALRGAWTPWMDERKWNAHVEPFHQNGRS
jgi:hypothetical protein